MESIVNKLNIILEKMEKTKGKFDLKKELEKANQETVKSSEADEVKDVLDKIKKGEASIEELEEILDSKGKSKDEK